MRPGAVLSLLWIAMLVAGAAHAGDYYKWTDANGTVHYSQTPPPDHASSAIHVSDDAPTPVPPSVSDMPPTQEQKAKTQSSQAALERADTQAMSANCAAAKKNIANLQGHGMLVASGGDPDSARALDAQARDQALTVARKDAATYCAHQP